MLPKNTEPNALVEPVSEFEDDSEVRPQNKMILDETTKTDLRLVETVYIRKITVVVIIIVIAIIISYFICNKVKKNRAAQNTCKLHSSKNIVV